MSETKELPTQKNTMKDRCPDWAHTLILFMRDMEIKLGHIPDSPDWQTAEDLDELHARVFSQDIEDTFIDDAMLERVFSKIVQNLSGEDFSVQEIVAFINARIGYKGGPPYCNEDEVEYALHHCSCCH